MEFFGIYPEKLLNLCSQNGISIWSARYVGGRIRCKITVSDFLKLPKILKKSGIRVHILEKHGFPFIMKKYNKRIGFFAGVVLLVVFLEIMSGYIWMVEVVGASKVPESKIITACKSLGIAEGCKKSKIHSKNLAQELLLKVDGLAWGSLNIEGCKVTVNVTEITEKEEDNTLPCNLVAAADGVISHIDVTAGNCVVKVGDVVKKGDLLVSGIIENQNGTKFVHSIGRIEADTETQIALEEKFTEIIEEPTGKVKEKKVLSFFGIKIPLYLGSENGAYQSEKKVDKAQLFSQKLPISIHTKRFIFVERRQVKCDYSQTVEKLEKALLKYGDDIEEKEYNITKDGVVLNAILKQRKNIAVSSEIITS